jgi:pimeloyl-ACP methyl ester carboxylesterase
MRFEDIAYPLAERWVELGSVRICYVVRPAAAETSRPVLLISPLGRGLMHYRLNLDGLAKLGPVLAYDPPGCGKSHKVGPALDLVDLSGQVQVAAAILEAARRAGEVPPVPALLVGTSYGALIALGLTHDRPDLSAGLVLSNAAGARPGMLGRVTSFLLSRESVLRRLGRESWRRGLERMFADPNHPAVGVNLDLAMQLRAGPDWPDYVAALARTTRAAMAVRPDRLLETVRERRKPSLVVWGTHDRVTPLSWGRELAARLLAKLEIIDRAGHFPNIEAPEVFEETVRRFARHI